MQPPELPPLADVVLRLAGVFAQLGVPYAIGGAVATSFWGVPRTTSVELFIPVVPLQHSILKRAVARLFHGHDIRVTTAEDLILLKMAFHRHKDLQDIKGILHVQRGRLDIPYLRHWSGQMLEISTSLPPMIVVRCPFPRVSSSRHMLPVLRSHWLPSLARTVACPVRMNIHCLEGVQCQPPTQSAANLRRFHPSARLMAETSRGGAGGANCSDWSVMVAVSMCDSPASSENKRMYSKG